ncbi:SIR2 family protein [Photobacterium sp. Alg240-V54]|uniref:SIR2 family protein n=1 Tax=Photobacterium sp. Alg240-V54 TaxID=2305995 RepID=UPI0013D0C211|nr:SIR2 family protein [Photobacterium sp. Alg240-V54]
MTIIKKRLIENFKDRSSGPFLFIGSGFSKRYLNLDDWKGLLSRFCTTGKPFTYYIAKGRGDIPLAARLIAEDFNEHWWVDEKYEQSRLQHSHEIKDETTALRIEISKYLETLDTNHELNELYRKEIETISELNVDGIITTNWDMYLESLFPDYCVYTGQSELLFSNPQNIGEIYKIHGSRKIPDSLVLTDSDYKDFNDRNPYLASKLITIFVEHPVIFIGYSLSDPNIKSLLSSIAKCIGSNNIQKLRNNLLFLQRLDPEDKADSIQDTVMAIDDVQIPITLIKTDDFSQVYESIIATKRKIPVRFLRHFKEQFYNLVKTNTPENEKKICVIGIDQIDDFSDVEFVVGVGVAEQHRLSQIGYEGLTISDLINDVLYEQVKFDGEKILDIVIPKKIGHLSPYIPTWKYLNQVGIRNINDYKKSIYNKNLDKWALINIKDKLTGNKNNKIKYEKNHEFKTITDLIKTMTFEQSVDFIPFIQEKNIDLDVLQKYLVDHKNEINGKKSTQYRKLACLYDHLKYKNN